MVTKTCPGAGTAVLGLVMFAVAVVPAPVRAKRPFTVADSIEMTQLADPNLRFTGFRSLEVKRSPDGTRFLIVTTKGDLERGCNEFHLLMFDFAAVKMRIDGGAQPRPTDLASFCTASNRYGITKAKWIDDHSVAFLGENPHNVSQLFVVDTVSKTLTKLTSHPTPVIDYDLNASDRFVYMAITHDGWDYRRAHGYAVGTEPFLDVVSEGALETFHPAGFYIGYRSGRPPMRVAETPYQLGIMEPPGISLSPCGRWAVVIREVSDPPKAWWSGYPLMASRIAAYYGGIDDADGRDFSTTSAFFKQFALVDLDTGKSTPILDAPNGLQLGGIAANALWESGETRLVLANTFLPLEPRNGQSVWPVVAEYDLGAGKITQIAEIKPGAFEGKIPKGLFLGAKFASDGSLLLSFRGADDWHDSLDRYIRTGAGWVQADSAETGPGITISIDQDSNTWPQLVATSRDGAKHAIITNFNSQLAALELGNLETIEWTDAYGHAWTGGLIKPIGYQPGHRYPLVIQTHGYRPGEFFVDGHLDFTSGYAARAIANRGMAVLQVNDVDDWDGTRDKLVKLVRPYESAVAMLDRTGLVDRDKVGIHGFSAYGIHVEQILTNTDLKIAAASVADGSEYSVMNSVMWYGMFYPGMLADERMIGVPLWGDKNVELWAERDPTFHLDRIKSPLLIENNETNFPWFDVFARLRRHHRPVELISLPGATHLLFQPWQRLTAQEAVVDWYDFWLMGHEDPAPPKATQYVRWRAMRGTMQSAAH